LNIPAEIQTGINIKVCSKILLTHDNKESVPQGSVLGPLLFLIFINDVADNMTGFGRLFADDTCIGHMAQYVKLLGSSFNKYINMLCPLTIIAKNNT
jgi:hypothetical protein